MIIRSSFIVSAVIGSCTILIGLACSSADLKALPVTEAGPPICSTAPEIRCDASAPSPQTCVGDPDSGTRAAMLPTNVSYGDGCQAFFRAMDCSSVGNCECDAPEGGTAFWNCTR